MVVKNETHLGKKPGTLRSLRGISALDMARSRRSYRILIQRERLPSHSRTPPRPLCIVEGTRYSVHGDALSVGLDRLRRRPTTKDIPTSSSIM